MLLHAELPHQPCSIILFCTCQVLISPSTGSRVCPWDCVLSQLEVDVSITVCLKSCPGLLLCPGLVAWVEEVRAQVGRPRLECCVIVLSHHTLEKTSEVSLSQLPS